MRKQLIATSMSLLVALVAGCSSMSENAPMATASTMTQTSPVRASDDPTVSTGRSRGLSGIFRRRPATEAPPTTNRSSLSSRGPTIVAANATPSRAQRAIDVLRRSPLGRLGRWMTGGTPAPSVTTTTTLAGTGTTNTTTGTTTTGVTTPAAGRVVLGQPVDTGSGIRSSVTGNPVDDVPGVTPQTISGSGTGIPITAAPAGTTMPQQTAEPGAGRVVMGQPADTGSGIRSTVTGTPVEPIPGVTPASSQVQPTLSTGTPGGVSGTAAAASAPPRGATVTTTPPVAAIAPAEPAPGTSVANQAASSSEVTVEHEADGTPVITNEEAEPTTKSKTKKKTAKPKK